MNIKRGYLILVFTAAVAIFILPDASAQSTVNKTDTLNIYVTVANLTMVDINPANLTWINIPPGTESNSSYAASGNKEAIQIENIGSTNITNIWFNVSQPSVMPFGSGDINNYDPGNFIVIRRNTTGAKFYFVDRKEFNESELIYLTLPGGEVVHGRLRSANHEYFWVVNVTDGTCNDTEFWIGNSPHNQTDTGTVDFTQACGSLTGTVTEDCRTGNFVPSSDNQWGVLNLTVGPSAGGENYTVIIPTDCTGNNVTIRFWHWNMDAPGSSGSSNAFQEYFRTTPLVPGAKDIANVKIRVPYGTIAGTLPTGYLTVIAQAVGVSA